MTTAEYVSLVGGKFHFPIASCKIDFTKGLNVINYSSNERLKGSGNFTQKFNRSRNAPKLT